MFSIGEKFVGLCYRKSFRIVFISVISISLIAILVFVFTNGQAKEPLTCEQFDNIALELGYDTTDSTEQYREEFGDVVIGGRGIYSSVLRFEFLEFNNDDSASSLWTGCYKEIIKNRSKYDIEYENYYSNYSQYALKSSGKYYTVINVGNTTVLAECANEESIDDIIKILAKMNYNPKNNENAE